MKCWHLIWLSRRRRRRRRPPWLIFSNPIESNKGERSGISWINSAVKMYGAPCAAASCDKSDALGNYFTGRPEWQHDQLIGSPAPAAQSSGKHHRLIFSVCSVGCCSVEPAATDWSYTSTHVGWRHNTSQYWASQWLHSHCVLGYWPAGSLTHWSNHLDGLVV